MRKQLFTINLLVVMVKIDSCIMITNVLCKGHRYGTTLVPMSEDDKLNMKYKAEKCLKALGFTDAQNVRTVTNVCSQSKLCLMSL